MNKVNDDENAIVFCNEKMANIIKESAPDMSDALVMFNGVPDNTAFMASADDFINWLLDNSDIYERGDADGK